MNMSRHACLGCLAVTVSLIICICLLPTIALPQSATNGTWFTDPEGISTPAFLYAPPPSTFDPLSASEPELEQYGFPPRPEASNALRYAAWKKMVMAKRVVPEIRPTKTYAGPPKGLKIGGPVAGAITGTSDNWSAYVADGANGTFTANNSNVSADWLITRALGPCDNSHWDYSSQWVGLDGWGSGDVLQAGTEADASCGSNPNGSGHGGANWYAWFEWYPFAQSQVGLAVGPGDLMQVEVWYTTSSPHGHASILNVTSGQTAVVGFNPPSGTNYVGNSAEWVLERTSVNGSLPNLTRYGTAAFNFAQAYNGSNYFYPSSAPAGTTIYNVSMTCPPWVNISGSSCTSTTVISAVSLIGTYTLWFTREGPPY